MDIPDLNKKLQVKPTHSNIKINHHNQKMNFFTRDDNKILELICGTHVHSDVAFDNDSLFAVVENIIKPATQIVDKVVQGNQVHVENGEEIKTPKSNFSVPVCTLKQIGCELSGCNPPGLEVAHNTTMAILNKLPNYSWEAKGVLTLAAFAIEFGGFSLLVQLHQSGLLAKSLAIVKRASVLITPLELQKHKQTILDLNSLIKVTLQVIEKLFEFESLSKFDPKDIPQLSVIMNHIPVDVYWAIQAVVACATKLTILTSDEEKPLDLSSYSNKVLNILNKLTMNLQICYDQKDEYLAYIKLKKLITTPSEIKENIKALIFFSKDKVPPQPLIDGSGESVPLDVLKGKIVFLFISDLDISDEDISVLQPVYDHKIRNEGKTHALVWLPIVEQWNEELQKKFEDQRSKMKWYTVQFFSRIAGFRYIKEEWKFKGKPKVVILNPQGGKLTEDGFNLIHTYGLEGFPYYNIKKITIPKLPQSVLQVVHAKIKFTEETFILFYGGKDNEWIQNFTKSATNLANDPFIKESRISIKILSVGNTDRGEDLGMLGRFWSGFEHMFFSRGDDHKLEVHPVTQEIQKLLSYKNESAWALLSKGSQIVVFGRGKTFLKVLDEFEKWKELVRQKDFNHAFKDYHERVSPDRPHCSRLDITRDGGHVPEAMNCPECSRAMVAFTTFKCCHTDGPLNPCH